MSEKFKIEEHPPYKFWCLPFLKALHNLGGSAKFSEIFQGTLSLFDVTDSVREESTEFGNNYLKIKIHQARQSLRDVAGYIRNVEFGVLSLTSKGREAIPNVLATLEKLESVAADEYIDAMVSAWENWEASAEKSPPVIEDSLQAESDFTDEENSAKEEEQIIQDDLSVVGGMDPYAFERLCKEIFKKLDYQDVENTRPIKDGGFDGFGYLVFGLVRFKVAFEAKKYTPPNKVGLEKVKAFESTMREIKAQKGVFITTSYFTREAEDFAKRMDITLVNGERLIELLREHKIGYSLKPVIDKKFFKNF